MSSAIHVEILGSFSLRTALPICCSHLSTACVSCVHLILCTPTGVAGIAPCLRLWNIMLETQLKVSWAFFLCEYPSVLEKRGGIPMRCCLLVEADGNREWCWCLTVDREDFMDGWCVGLYERFFWTRRCFCIRSYLGISWTTHLEVSWLTDSLMEIYITNYFGS